MQFLKLLWKRIALLMAGLTFWMFCSCSAGEHDDAFCGRILATGKNAEARTWALEAKGAPHLRTVHELDNAGSLAVIEKLYALGAERVVACNIGITAGGGEATDELIVILPNAVEARKRLLNYERSYSKRRGFGGVNDAGQRYMLIWK